MAERKTQPVAVAVEDDSGFRRRSDEIIWNVFQEKFHILSKDVEELTVTIRGYNGDVGLVGRVAQMEAKLDQIFELLSKHHAPAVVSAPEDRPLTSGHLANSFVQNWFKPVITALVTALAMLAVQHILK